MNEIGRASCRERGYIGDWSSDVCSSDLTDQSGAYVRAYSVILVAVPFIRRTVARIILALNIDK